MSIIRGCKYKYVCFTFCRTTLEETEEIENDLRKIAYCPWLYFNTYLTKIYSFCRKH